ncbi:MAG: radical SAM protein [Acidobacteriota bacterium]
MMKVLELVRHLRALRSAPSKAVVKRVATILPDYLLGNGSSRALVNITLEVTYRCNVKCEFCFLKDSVLNQKRDELTHQEVARLADQAMPYGAAFFITGGEPFLRRDLPEMISAIKSRGLRVGVNTNGLLVDEKRGAAIREAGLDYIIFSLHGPREVHDCLENRRGSFDQVMSHLTAFSRRKGSTRVIANCVVAKQNADRLSEVPALLAHIPLDAVTFQHETFLTAGEVAAHEEVWKVLFPQRPLPMVFQSSGYGRRDFGALDREIDTIQTKNRKWPFPVFFKPFLQGKKLRSWYTSDMDVKGRCLYIWTDTRVEPDGTVNACQVMPTPMGNVRENSLEEILNGTLYREFRAKNREIGGVFPACARCCKLYRNPMNFAARQPKWKTRGVVVESQPSS